MTGAAHAGAESSSERPERGIVPAVVRLSRRLRERGVAVTPADAMVAVQALEAVDLGDRREVYLALRATLVHRIEDFEAFHEIFDWAWQGGRDGRRTGGTAAAKSRAESITGAGSRRTDGLASPTLERWLGREDGAGARVGVATLGVGEAKDRKDFSTYDPSDLDAIRRVAVRMARRLAVRPSRRWKPCRRGDRPDPRGTLRRSLATGGEAVVFGRRTRRLRKTKVVVLCDVSGSMDLYARFLMQFLYAMQHAFTRVETFVFSTRLSRITDPLKTESYVRALDRLGAEVHGWSGGTRIGECLACFIRDHAQRIDRRTLILILSDGWDTGEPEVLGTVMGYLHRRAGKVIWLNPLLGNPDYRPLTRGMQAALPHVDVFASAHNLAALSTLATHLRL